MALPVPVTLNHAYIHLRNGSKILTKRAKEWMDTAKDIAAKEAKRQHWEMSEDDKVVMEIMTYWPDKRRRDTHNGSKLLADALEGIVYKDDKRALLRYMDYDVDRCNPRVELKIYLKQEEDYV